MLVSFTQAFSYYTSSYREDRADRLPLQVSTITHSVYDCLAARDAAVRHVRLAPFTAPAATSLRQNLKLKLLLK